MARCSSSNRACTRSRKRDNLGGLARIVGRQRVQPRQGRLAVRSMADSNDSRYGSVAGDQESAFPCLGFRNAREDFFERGQHLMRVNHAIFVLDQPLQVPFRDATH